MSISVRFGKIFSRSALAFRRELSGMTTDVVPINILKTGEDPELKPDDEYPAWLWKLASPPPTLGELSAKYESAAGGMDLTEGSRFLGLERRQKISTSNRNKGKK